MPTCIHLSTQGTNLTPFAKGTGTAYRKDFIRDGVWVVNKGGSTTELPVDEARMKKWEESFKLFRERGISVPLSVDHIQVTGTGGKPLLRKMTPGMAEAKRGDVVNLFREGTLGICEVVPADPEAEALMARCPEVSLELESDFVDGYGNHYPEAITAITLTPIPVVPGQQLEWEPVAQKIAASRNGVPVEEATAEYSVELSRKATKEHSMSPSLLARARAALKMHSDPEEEVHAKMVHHLESCGRSTYLSREDHDKALAEAVTAAKAEVTAALTKTHEENVVKLSRELDQAKTGTRMLTIEELAKGVDEDALEMYAGAIETRIHALGNRVTPAQKTLLMSRLLGEKDKRNVVALSRKTAKAVGLDKPTAETVLEILEAGNPVEMAKLLQEQSGTQRRTELSRETNPEGTATADYDPNLTKEMVERANGITVGKFNI